MNQTVVFIIGSQTSELLHKIVEIDFGLAFVFCLEKDALTTEEEGKILASHSTKKGDEDHELVSFVVYIPQIRLSGKK